MGPHAHPEVTMHTHSLADYVACLQRADWDGVGQLMLSSVRKLAAGGADFVICLDNTIHQALPGIKAVSPLPWLHIADTVADQAVGRGYKRLWIMGTSWLVGSDVYPQKLAGRGIDYLRPGHEEREEINRIIMDELVYGICKPDSVATFQRVIDGLRAGGCDAVILGCTEIPLVISDANSPLPTLDSTRLLARAALDHAIGKTPGKAPGMRRLGSSTA